MPLNIRSALPQRPLPELPAPPEGLADCLAAALPESRIRCDSSARLRAGTGHSLNDIWRLRACELPRMPDVVVRPESEEEVLAVLQAASSGGFAVVPVGGRTNVTSATRCPGKDIDARPFVALDMRGLTAVQWVNSGDRVACIEAGISGTALKETLAKQGVTMGMEPDSMELSTLGGWIATRASGMKRERYGNIEDMLVEVRVATPAGLMWQRHGTDGGAQTAYGRASTGTMLPGLVLGSEGCLGVIVAAVVRVWMLPEVVDYQSVIFPNWEAGAGFMQELARIPRMYRPASCRLMDNLQLRLAGALKEEEAGGLTKLLKPWMLRAKGVNLASATAATMVLEGGEKDVSIQMQALAPLVKAAGGVWGGASNGEAGYGMTFAIAYLRDFTLDHRILAESLETQVPWSKIAGVWPAVVAAVSEEHLAMRLPGTPVLMCRLTQLYNEGGVLYMYLGIYTGSLDAEAALEAYERLEHTAREAILAAGGCLSHHHGVGKHRAQMLSRTQSPALEAALWGLKASVDPENVLGARNGAWASLPPTPAPRG